MDFMEKMYDILEVRPCVDSYKFGLVSNTYYMYYIHQGAIDVFDVKL